MKISISDRFKPFSHKPGVRCLLPHSKLCFQFYPSLMHVFDLSGPKASLISSHVLNIQGFVKDFTVQQDLEKGVVRIWGHAKNGYFRYSVVPGSSEKDFQIVVEKEPNESNLFQNSSHIVESKDECRRPLPSLENLSFGSSKAQDCDQQRKKGSLLEILPLWYRLGQLLPKSAVHYEGTASLLLSLEKALAAKDSKLVADFFHSLYLSGFEGLLSPRLSDEEHQGFDLPALTPGFKGSPLVVATHGASLIKQMIVADQGALIDILPCLPLELHCGRMLGVSIGTLGVLDLEWSKKTIRRMLFSPACDLELQFQFHRQVKTFRLRNKNGEKGEVKENMAKIKFQKENKYLFDNFMR